MERLRGRLTYANVISTIALFLVLAGGTAFAAKEALLPRNSVGAKQLKAGAVTPAKLSKASKATMIGATGPAGPTGLTGRTGAKGDRGEKGEVGRPGPFPAALPAGRTVVGVYQVEDTASGPGAVVTGDISYVYSAPGQQVEYVPTGATNAHCTGTYVEPTAPSGYTCIYEANHENVAGGEFGISFDQSSGVGLYATSAAPGFFFIYGTWAATGQ